MNGSGIDTSALLTMLGLVAAVWAVVPSTARLSFRLSMSPLDWVVIGGAVFAIHVLYFEPVLRDLDAYWVIGPWRWGFDKGGAQYVIFLVLLAYIYARSRRTRLNRRSLPVFDSLATSLLHSRKFDELTELLDHHLGAILEFAGKQGARRRLVAWLRAT